MTRLTTHDTVHIPGHHHPTPTKAEVQGAIKFCKAKNLDYRKREIFQSFDIPPSNSQQFLYVTSASQ